MKWFPVFALVFAALYCAIPGRGIGELLWPGDLEGGSRDVSFVSDPYRGYRYSIEGNNTGLHDWVEIYVEQIHRYLGDRRVRLWSGLKGAAVDLHVDDVKLDVVEDGVFVKVRASKSFEQFIPVSEIDRVLRSRERVVLSSNGWFTFWWELLDALVLAILAIVVLCKQLRAAPEPGLNASVAGSQP